MALQDKEQKIKEIELKILTYKNQENKSAEVLSEITKLEKEHEMLFREAYDNLTAYDRVYLARKQDRPNTREYIDNIFTDFVELHGDRLNGEDYAILGGIAFLDNTPVTVIGTLKGKNVEENVKCRFGMPNPQGYRKALRLMKQAEKFDRPIVTFIDTAGAYPGIEAEEHGQGEAIARNLMEMSALKVPVIAIVIGEGGSGGALALSVADRIWMLENAIYSILSPEGFASILYKDSSKAKEAAEIMKLTARDLASFGIADKIVRESIGGVSRNKYWVFNQIKELLLEEIPQLQKLKKDTLVSKRYQKFRKIGNIVE